MPSGHVLYDALEHPQFHGGLKCLIPVPKEVFGPHEGRLSWYSHEFSASAQDAYQAIGSPKISLNSAWDVFCAMSDVIEDL